MSISRRSFLIGTATGLVLPSFYDRALTYLARNNRPLLELPAEHHIELVAVDRGSGDYELNLGDPYAEPPQMTFREYAIRYWDSEDEYLEAFDCQTNEIDWDALVDPWQVCESWARCDSPNARAYRLLEDLDFGRSLRGLNAVGELTFTDGPCPGNDYIGVSAADEITISLLQNRLNEMDVGCLITMEYV